MTNISRPLPRKFYNRGAADVAHDLLGAILVRSTDQGLSSGRIVETEAYLPTDDAASHSFRGLTPRNASMFGPPGHAYVYTIHARFCFNAVTEEKGVGSAVLVRAIEPLEGMELMVERRGKYATNNLVRGPARLCEALDVDRSWDGWDLTDGEQLWIEQGATPLSDRQIVVTSRIGISTAQDKMLRFIVQGNKYVSGTAAINRSGQSVDW